MTWHWSYKTLPELAGLPDAEKLRLCRRCHLRALRRPVVWVAVAGAMTAAFAAARLAAPWMPDPADGPGAFLLGLLVGLPGGLVVATVLIQVILQAMRPCLRRERPGRCRRCGYDLTGNASGTCPECGTPAGEGAI